MLGGMAWEWIDWVFCRVAALAAVCYVGGSMSLGYSEGPSGPQVGQVYIGGVG
jgi:hypothetical protein